MEELLAAICTCPVRLSGIAAAGSISVYRDRSFDNLGFLHQRGQPMLAFLEHERFLPALLKNDWVSVVLTRAELVQAVPEKLGVGVCSEPRLAFALVHNRLASAGFYWRDFPTSIAPDASVHPTAWIAERNVRIGPRTIVEPRAAILERCVIGEDVLVGAGAVLGGVGFQTARTQQAVVE